MEELTSHALIGRVEELLARERRIVVAFLRHLGEVERRRLHLELGFGSLFAFCTDRLRLSTGTAWRRVTAVKLIGMHPVICDYLVDGRLSLAALGELKDVLGGEDGAQILERAAGRTQMEVKELVAGLRPVVVARDVVARVSKVEGRGELFAGSGSASVAVSKVEPPAAVVPIADENYRLHATISRACKDKLDRVKSMLSHVVPDGKLDRIIEICVERTLAQLEKRRGKVAKPRVCKPARGRHVPADIAREVWDRDGESCAYVAGDGTRCGSTYQLQLHHIHAYELGGLTIATNLSVRCAAHNRFHAENDFGRAVIAERVRGRSG